MDLRDRLLRLALRLRHPKTTVRGRLTTLYGGLFLASGVVLLAITYVLAEYAFPAVTTLPPGAGASRVAGDLPGHGPADPAATISLVNQLRDEGIHKLLVDSSGAFAAMVVISIALGWVVAGRVLRPLRTITAATRQISERNLHQRLALGGPPDELTDLGDTIDGLLARLQRAFDAQRRFAANASHELRTPITVERALLEMVLTDPDATIETYRSICQDLLETGQQQEQVIEALLTLASSQQGLEQRQPVDLAAITGEVVRVRQPAAASRHVRVDVALHPAAIAGDASLIERLVSNLLDNALRYNHPGGVVLVAVGTQSDQPVLQVTNTGPVVPPGEASRLLEPFQRLTGDRAGQHDGLGLGLGLSIVQAIASAHDAHLDLQPGKSGGLDIRVCFQALSQLTQRGT